MTHAELQELLGVYALDALERDEAEVVERHLETCPRCADEVRGHREVAAMLAYAGTSAPSGLWDRIASELHSEAEPAGPVLLPTFAASEARKAAAPAPAAGRRRHAVAVLAAAAAVAVIVGATGAIVSLRSTLHTQQRKIDANEALNRKRDISELAAQAAATEGAKSVHLQDAKGGALADAIVLPSGEAYLLPKALPALPEGQTYQLWAVSGKTTISAGVLGASPRTSAFYAPIDTRALALTVEKNPGVTSSTQSRYAYALVPPDAP